MKSFIKSIVITTALAGSLLASPLMAAETKIGVVNFQEIMGAIPQTAAVMQQLEKEFSEEKSLLTNLEKDIKSLQEKKKRDGALLSAKDKAALDAEIGSKYQEYQTKGQAFQQKVNVRQQDEQNKIIALVRNTIDEIVKKEKYHFVFEQKAVVSAMPSSDISKKVIAAVSKIK